MKHSTRLQICILTLFLLQCPSVNAGEPLHVVVSIPPQVYFVKQISGDLVDVISMLPESGFPHTYEPTPKQMKFLSNADLYVRIHVEFEDAWWEKIVAVNPEMPVIDSTEGIEIRDDEHDPHIWLAPRLVKIQAETICEGLIHIDPANGATYTTNKTTFLRQLDRLDHEIRTLFTDISDRTFMVFHPSWTYFASEYDLEQLPIEVGGKEPTPSEMAALINIAKSRDIQVIFVQPQTSMRSAETIARQLGATIEVLDPLAGDWMENMRAVAKILANNFHEE